MPSLGRSQLADLVRKRVKAFIPSLLTRPTMDLEGGHPPPSLTPAAERFPNSTSATDMLLRHSDGCDQ
jgi:hypothetical protein